MTLKGNGYGCFILLSLLFSLSNTLPAQDQSVDKDPAERESGETFGIQFKPVFTSSFLNTGPVTNVRDPIEVEVIPAFGYTFGMVIRKDFTEHFSAEVGINYVERDYDLTIRDPDSAFTGVSDFEFVNYEIPLRALYYVRIGERFYMNSAAGVSFDMFPSDVSTSDSYFNQLTIRNEWIQAAILANVGFEYRTEGAGRFYLGGSFHQPFTDMAVMVVNYKKGNEVFERRLDLPGNYITIDLRYFFAEE